MHELLHFRQLKRNKGRFGKRHKGIQNVHSMEIEAYKMEKRLLEKYGDDVNADYTEYLDEMIDHYESK